MSYKNKDGKVSSGNLAEFVLAFTLCDNVEFSPTTESEELTQEINDNTPRVQVIRTECEVVKQQLPEFVRVVIAGSDSRSKADLYGFTADNTKHPLSLKRDNNAPERRQGQSWQNIEETYGQFGLDVSDWEGAFKRVAPHLTSAGLRYSSKKADWSPELHQRADDFQAFFAHMESSLCDRVLNSSEFVRGVYDVILGTEQFIYYVELDKASVKRVERRDVDLSPLTLVAETSASGRTTRLRVFHGDTLLAYTENSVKAQRATKKQAAASGLPTGRDTRSICPQTKFCVTEALKALL